MSLSVADIYEDYLESLQNLPSEIDQNMHELRQMDDDLQKCRETYAKHRRHVLKQKRIDTAELEKEYTMAIQKQDQKIELAMRMYDLVSRHIERLDSQVMTKSNLNASDWIKKKKRRRLSTTMIDHNNSRKRTMHHSNTRENAVVVVDPNEPRYCYCQQVSFGDMVACDGDNCEREWFHYPCVGLVEPPAGKWFCEECSSKLNNYHPIISSEEEEST